MNTLLKMDERWFYVQNMDDCKDIWLRHHITPYIASLAFSEIWGKKFNNTGNWALVIGPPWSPRYKTGIIRSSAEEETRRSAVSPIRLHNCLQSTQTHSRRASARAIVECLSVSGSWGLQDAGGGNEGSHDAICILLRHLAVVILPLAAPECCSRSAGEAVSTAMPVYLHLRKYSCSNDGVSTINHSFIVPESYVFYFSELRSVESSFSAAIRILRRKLMVSWCCFLFCSAVELESSMSSLSEDLIEMELSIGRCLRSKLPGGVLRLRKGNKSEARAKCWYFHFAFWHFWKSNSEF